MIFATAFTVPTAGPQGAQAKGNGFPSNESGKGFGALLHGGAKAPARNADTAAKITAQERDPANAGECSAGQDSAVKMLAALTEASETGESADDLAADELGTPQEAEGKADDEAAASNLFAFSPLQLMERRMPHGLGRDAKSGNEAASAEDTKTKGDAALPGETDARLKAEGTEAKPASKTVDVATSVSADALAASVSQARPSEGSKPKTLAASSAALEAVRALGLPSGAGAEVAPLQGGTSSQMSWERGSEGGTSGERSLMRNAEAAIGLWGSKLAEDASVQGVDADDLSSTMPTISATPAALASALAKPADAVQATASSQPLLAHALEHTASQNQRTLKLQLHPTELGAVTAKLRVSGEGLSVELQVETDAAREKLGADNGEAIRAALSALGLKIESVSVQAAPNGSAAQAGADSGSGSNSNANRQPGFATENGEGRGNGRGAGGNAEGQGRGGQSERVGGARADGAGRAQPGVFI